jgi:hypothetical protein
LEFEGVRDLLEDAYQPADLLIGVGGRDLNAEANLALGHEGISGHRHVDTFVEQKAPDCIDVGVVGERDLDDPVITVASDATGEGPE